MRTAAGETVHPVEVRVAFVSHHPGWDEQQMTELPTSSLTHQDKRLFTSPQESRTTDNPSYLKRKVTKHASKAEYIQTYLPI